MKQKKLLLVLLLGISSAIGFSQNIAQLKEEAYQAQSNQNYKIAIQKYKQALDINPNDSQIHLALGKLYYKLENYPKATYFLNRVYVKDRKNEELIDLIGNSYLFSGKLYGAVNFYLAALEQLPENIKIYFQLAKAYSWKGQMKKAIEIYKKILELDNTYAEAWQGIGKMYYWMGKSYSSAKNYQKAISLDPTNIVLQKEYAKVKKTMTFQTFGKWSLINENERHYDISAITQKYGVSKIITDNLQISANFLADHSNKILNQQESNKIKKIYTNAFVNIDYALGDSRFKLYSGYTFSDKKMSSYGLKWKYTYRIKSFEISNELAGGYDYFYYWNNVGEHAISDNFTVKYNRLKLILNAKHGLVDSLMIFDEKKDEVRVDFNHSKGGGASLSYEIMSKPKLEVSAHYSYFDYRYKSKLYYTPSGRNLYGLSTSLFYPVNNFYFYGSFGYNLGSEYYFDITNDKLEPVYIDVDNWSANAEVGYELNTVSFSLGASRFFNPYYANFDGYFTARLYF